MPLDPQRNPLDGLRSMVLRGPTPLTNSIVFINIVLLVLTYVSTQIAGFAEANLVVTQSTALKHPWSLVLYPLMPPGPIMLLFWGFTFWQFGGSLERSWGTARYSAYFAAVSALSALSVLLGGYLFHQPVGLATFLLPLAGIVIAFCALNPNDPINCWFVNIPSKWVMAIVFALVWFFMGNPIIGLFAEAGPLASLWYVSYGRSWGDIGHYTKRPSRGEIIDFQAARKRKSNAVYLDGSIRRSPFDIRGRWRDMQERKKLARLLKNSGLLDPEDRR